jgi:hypothetical protein
VNSPPIAAARSTSVSSMQSAPVSIAPITLNALMPLFAPCRDNRSRSSTSSAKPIRCANTAAGSNPADGTRFASSKVTDTRDRS